MKKYNKLQAVQSLHNSDVHGVLQPVKWCYDPAIIEGEIKNCIFVNGQVMAMNMFDESIGLANWLLHNSLQNILSDSTITVAKKNKFFKASASMLETFYQRGVDFDVDEAIQKVKLKKDIDIQKKIDEKVAAKMAKHEINILKLAGAVSTTDKAQKSRILEDLRPWLESVAT